MSIKNGFTLFRVTRDSDAKTPLYNYYNFETGNDLKFTIENNMINYTNVYSRLLNILVFL